jgi:uncharacterized phage-associated protein
MKQPLGSANEIADYLIWKAHEHGSFISNLKLQKLLYYAQGWHIAVFDQPLFTEPLEAWVHGPVVPSIYRRFKSYGFQNIDEAVRPSLTPAISQFLDDLARSYLGIDAYALELMTHSEDPWLLARGDLAPQQASRTRISLYDIRTYFRGRLERGE